MVRDLDLLRQILSAAEKLPAGNPGTDLDLPDDLDDQVVGEHIQLLIDDDLVEGDVTRGMDRIHGYLVVRLTSRGHDFLQFARSDTLWHKAKSAVAGAGGTYTIQILLDWLKAEALRRLGLS